jgi:hypothetical protein
MENGPSVAVMRRIGMTHLADTPMDGRLITAFVAP